MRVWIRPFLGGLGGCQILEILILLGLQDLVTNQPTDWLTDCGGDYSQGSAGAGWLRCIVLRQNESARGKGRFGEEEDNLLFYFVDFQWLTTDIWEPMSNSGLQGMPDRCLLGLILCSCLIGSVHSCHADFLSLNTVGSDWGFLVSKVFITVLLRARDYGLPLFTSASTLLPSSGLFSPQALALCHFLGSLPWPPQALSQIS